MQLITAISSLALASSVLAAPRPEPVELYKRAPTCGKIGVTGVAPAYSYAGGFASPDQCAAQSQSAGYSSWSYDHVAKQCSFYSTPLSGLSITGGSPASRQYFSDKDCGDFAPTCNGQQLPTDANYILKWGQQYLLADLPNTSWQECITLCDAREDCWAIGIKPQPNTCLLYSQTAAFMEAGSPPLQGAVAAVSVTDLMCYAH